MTSKKKPSSGVKTLRHRAENVLKVTSMQVKKMSLREVQHLVHELQVHQIELEMQNEELRQAQLDLQQARDRYSDLYDFAPVGFLTLNTKGQILEANLPACQLLGVERKTLLLQKLEKFLMPTDQPILRKHLHNVEKTHTKEFSDVIRLKHNASPYVVRLESLYEELGLPNLKARFRIALLDRTEQEKTKALQKEQEIWIGAILDSAMDAIITIDGHRNIVLFNDSAEHVFGVASKEVLGQSIDQFIPQRFLKDHLAHIQNFKRGSSIKLRMGSLGEVTGLRANGKEFPIEASISKVTLETGVRYAVILRDITERRTIEEVREKEQFISTILDTTAAIVVVLDPEWRIVRFNQVCENLMGQPLAKIRGKFFRDLPILAGEKAQERKSLLALLKGRTFPKSFENAWVNRDRQVCWIKWSNTVIKDKNGKIENYVATGIDITSRKKAEQEILRLSIQNTLILNSAGEGIYGLDLQGNTTFVNPAAANMLGYEPQELLDIPMHKTVHHSKPDGSRYPLKKCPMYAAFKDGSVHHVADEVLWRKDGASFPVEYTSTPILGENRKIEGAVVTFKDITERKKEEAKVRKLSKVFMNAADPILIEDLEGRVIDLNDEAVKVYGWLPKELLGQPIKTIVPPGRHAQADELLERCRKGEDVRNVEGLRQDKTGNVMPVLLTLSLLNDGRGIPMGIATVSKDISLLKQAEKNVRENEERFQAFMNFSPTVAFLKDDKGRYLYVNRPFEEKLHLPMADCLGKTDQQLFPPEVARIFIEHDQRVVKTKKVLETEETTMDETGSVCYWWVMKFLVPRKTGPVLLGGVALDITSRKKDQEALKQREVELQGSQKMLQALGGQLISAQEDERRRISRELHDDMNQRLAVLAFNIQYAQKEVGTSSLMHQNLQNLYDGVSSLSDDVRHLAYQLHPSILDDLGLEVALGSFVDDFSKWEGIPVTFTATDMTVTLPQELASCLYRVAQEGMRNVSRHAQATQVDVRLIGVDGGVRLSIQDNGKGFELKKRKLGKHGLGLIGMEERVRVVAGTYEVKSAPGQGTQIMVWVPIPKEELLQMERD